MTNIISLSPRRRGRRLRMLVDGKITEHPTDDVWLDQIENYHRCIQGAKANMKRAMNQLMVERELIDEWEAKIAQLEARRDQLRAVVVDFPERD